MPPDPAQQRLFTPVETPHPPSGGANAKARLVAALMLRFDRERTRWPDVRWHQEVGDALLAVLLVVASGVYDGDGELRRLWRSITERHCDRDSFWTSSLPYDLVRELIDPYKLTAINDLGANLDHHNSGVRAWMLELGWVVRRRWLPVVRPRLFESFGGNLFDADEALALAYAVSEDYDEFIQAAEAYQPESHAEQYQKRLKEVRPYANGLLSGFRLGEVESRATALVLEELGRL